jgi:hypothetical protein
VRVSVQVGCESRLVVRLRCKGVALVVDAVEFRSSRKVQMRFVI